MRYFVPLHSVIDGLGCFWWVTRTPSFPVPAAAPIALEFYDRALDMGLVKLLRGEPLARRGGLEEVWAPKLASPRRGRIRVISHMREAVPNGHILPKLEKAVVLLFPVGDVVVEPEVIVLDMPTVGIGPWRAI